MKSFLWIIVSLVSVSVFAADGGAILLDAKDATVEDPAGLAKFETLTNRLCVGFWHSTNVVIRWKFDVPAKGAYRVILVYAAKTPDAGTDIDVSVGTQHANGTAKNTGDWSIFQELDLGPVLLRKPGPMECAIRATRMSCANAINCRAIRLVPEK